jgi:hypothetical protein
VAELVRYRDILFDSVRWDGFALRPDDIIITTPAKCGTTWTQMICALLIFQTTTFDRPLDVISPWLDMMTRSREEIVADLEGQEHRRFIKTHTPLDGIPWEPQATYIAVGRDPRDVFLSWDNHMANLDIIAVINARQNAVGLDDIMDRLAEGPPVRPEAEIDRFWEWVDGPLVNDDGRNDMNLAFLLHHLETCWEARDRSNVVLLHYDELTDDLEGEMRRLAGRLGIEVPEQRWSALVDAAGFEHMRERADVIAPETTSAIWHENQRFFNSGRSGQWKRLLTDDDVERYMRRVRELVDDPELIAWLHFAT